jgi:hypothetical protein
MAQRVFVVVAVLALSGIALTGQSKPSIQGVWRIAERTTTGPNGTTNKNPQPSLYIFTGKHYSLVSLTGDKPRSVLPLAPANTKLTDADMVAIYRDWQAVTANSGTYEVKGSTLALRPIVAKSSAVMANKSGLAYEFKLDGSNLTLTQTIGPTGQKPANPTTLRLVRVE